jgi:hypothetical protein
MVVRSVDELSAEFATDTPRKLALSRAAFRKYDREISGNVDVFGDHLDAAVRNVRDRAVARQRASPELDLREPSTETTFAFTAIR